MIVVIGESERTAVARRSIEVVQADFLGCPNCPASFDCSLEHPEESGLALHPGRNANEPAFGAIANRRDVGGVARPVIADVARGCELGVRRTEAGNL